MNKKVYVVTRNIVTPSSSILETVLVTPNFDNAEKEFLAQREDAYNYAKNQGFVIDSPGDDEFTSHSPDGKQRYDVKVELCDVER